MSKRNGQSSAISWVNERSDSTAEALVVTLNEDCRTNLQGVPAEMSRAIHVRALQKLYEIVTAQVGDLGQCSADQECFTYVTPPGGSSGLGANGGKRTVTRRKRRAKTTPKTESSTDRESDTSPRGSATDFRGGGKPRRTYFRVVLC